MEGTNQPNTSPISQDPTAGFPFPTRMDPAGRDEAQSLDAPGREQEPETPVSPASSEDSEPDDESRHSAPDREQASRDDLVTVHEAVEIFRAAGLERSIRTIQKYCSPQRKGRALKCHVTPTENGVRYMIEKGSIDRFIREAGAQAPVGGEEEEAQEPSTQPATKSNETANFYDHAIYDHPYVKRLESEIEKKDAKHDDLQLRYERAMDTAQSRLVELQQASAVAQSDSLGRFMLEAKRIDQSVSEPGRRDPDEGEQAQPSMSTEPSPEPSRD